MAKAMKAMKAMKKKIVSKIVETTKVFSKCQHLSLHHIEWGWATKTVYHFQIVTFLTKTNMPKYNSTKGIYKSTGLIRVDLVQG